MRFFIAMLLAFLPYVTVHAAHVKEGSGLICKLENKKIFESSGICASRRNPGVFWTHNDSGSGPFIFAFDAEGHDLGTFPIAAGARDWEDIAAMTVHGKNLLVIADVGDNAAKREDQTLIVIEEPEVAAYTAKAATAAPGKVPPKPPIKPTLFRFTWSDGGHNCEAVALTPDGLFLLITKHGDGKCAAFHVKTPLCGAPEAKKYTAEKIQDMEMGQVTGMDVSSDGLRCIVVTYGSVHEFTREATGSWADAFAKPHAVKAPMPPHTEAICYDLNGVTLWLTGETGNKKLSDAQTPLFCMPRGTENSKESSGSK